MDFELRRLLIMREYDSTHDYRQDYFTIKTLESGTITLYLPTSSTARTDLSYKVNNNNWTTISLTSEKQIINITTSNNDTILLKGNAIQWGLSFEPSSNLSSSGLVIASTNNITVSGNILSLFYDDNFTDKTAFPSSSYSPTGVNYLFYSNTKLISAKNLILENKLSDTRALFTGMFKGCSSLTEAPELPATTITAGCYTNMFRDCTSLTTAPVLPASTLKISCYSNMFRGCSSLNYIKMLATDTSAFDCLNLWVMGVSSTGTFVKHPDASLSTGNNGIPSGWTVQTASS